MGIIDIETEEYGLEKKGLHSAEYLRKQTPEPRRLCIRIGYNVAAAFGGVIMENTYK